MLTIAIPIFTNAEILDFSGPYEVFTTASRVRRRQGASEDLFQCQLVSGSRMSVRSRGGMMVTPDTSFAEMPAPDVLLVPGGDVSEPLTDERLLAWITAVHGKTTISASVCTGAFLLARAGLLDGLTVTTHWEDQDDLQKTHPALKVIGDVPWVDCGKVVTSGGISAGIDMSLHLVERLAGRELAIATARQMEYRWNCDGRRDVVGDTGLLSPA